MNNTLAYQATLILAVRSLFFCVRAVALLLLARLLSPDLYGGVILLFTVLEIGRVLADFGIDNRLTGDFSRLPTSDHPALFRRALTAKIVAAVLLMPVIAGFLRWWLPSMAPYLFLVATLPCVVTVSFSISYMQARQAISKSDIASLLGLVSATLVAFLACVWLGRPGLLFISILAFEIFSAMVLVSSAQRLLASCKEREEHPVSLRSLYLRVLPVGLTAIISTVYGRLDLLIAQRMVAADLFGQYSLITRISEPLILIAGTVAVAYYVRVARQTNEIPYSGGTSKTFVARYLLFAVACALIFCVVSAVCIHFLPTYRDAVPLIPYAACAVVTKVINQGAVAQLSGHSRYQSLLLISAFNFFMMSGTLLFFVTVAGVKGCLIAIALTESISTALMLGALNRVTRTRDSVA